MANAHRSTRTNVLVAVAAVGMLLGGCVGGRGPLAAEDPLFEGLEPAVVDEALALKGDVIAAAPDDQRAWTAQQIAVEIGVCRAAYAHLEAWPIGGPPPGELDLPRLTSDAVDAAAVDAGGAGGDSRGLPFASMPWDALEIQLRGLVDAEGRDGLVHFLQLVPGCWMSVAPGASGPSIFDAVAAEYGRATQ
ncbi:hypothetical protein HP550_13765 [Cellulomonas humilata]|uniref:Lipoprotein n=1 Tax=Cellulomonas humilata TaxID=144055 RepID=A0A7Y6A3A9_9CELL|nr:hypothetical protein [Cellulomonas humilata]NUU18318.1 hypothetical protein [Cellulomonas humilata]